MINSLNCAYPVIAQDHAAIVFSDYFLEIQREGADDCGKTDKHDFNQI